MKTFAVAALAAAAMMVAAPAASQASTTRVVYDDTAWLNPSEGVELGHTWLVAAKAGVPKCMFDWATTYLPVSYPMTMAARGLLRLMSGTDLCALSRQWSAIGGNLAYYSFRGGGRKILYRVYSVREYRGFARDRCTTWIYVWNRWLAKWTNYAPCFGQ